MLNRRQMILESALGLGALMGPRRLLAAPAHPLDPKRPHYRPRASRVIFLFQTGGVSHIDTFDPKPALTRDDGKKRDDKRLFGSPWKASPHGQSGIEVSELFPEVSRHIDEMTILRSMHGNHGDHFAATLHMHNGGNGSALPGIGAWISQGLGTLNLNLPSHVVFARREPYAGAQAWDANFLPAIHQGVRIRPGDDPLPYLIPSDRPDGTQDIELSLLQRLNQRHAEDRAGKSSLEARTLAFQTARKLQEIAPALLSTEGESEATLDAYGVKDGDNKSYAWQCLMARRLSEAGVRFIEIIDQGSHSNWDQHNNIKGHEKRAREIDQPTAALLEDLRQRGLLDETLVVWCTEFGRTPWKDANVGRGHFRRAFSSWMAGGGVRGGHVHGATDEHGFEIAKDPVSVHDFHATILHLLGLDHERLTYRSAGREFRLTDVHGRVLREIFA